MDSDNICINNNNYLIKCLKASTTRPFIYQLSSNCRYFLYIYIYNKHIFTILNKLAVKVDKLSMR